MEISAYLSINGRVQGKIEGSCMRLNRENQIVLTDFNHSVHVPGYSQAGTSSGSIVHKPISFAKEVDKSTPKLYQALVSKELLLEAKFAWYRYSPSGGEELYYSVVVKNAFITEIAPYTPEHSNLRFMERVQLAYDHISWSYGSDGEVTSEADCSGGAS